MMFTVVKIIAVMFGVGGLASIELGAEFFTTVNTLLNFVTLVYLQRQHAKVSSAQASVERAQATVERIEPRVEHVEAVAEQLDTRVVGGRRDYDPCDDDDRKGYANG
jgi:hypothetical protein